MNSLRAQLRITLDLLEIWRACNGYYKCPKNANGKRLGPLVGYAGKYDASDGTKKQFVGDEYYNFARVEQYHHALDQFSFEIASSLESEALPIDVLVGAPMGGLAFAMALARVLDCRFAYAEKRVTKAATAESREESVLVLDRHEVHKDDCVILVEDVCNNFSTTDKLIALVQNSGARVGALVCALNRSHQVIYQPQGPDTALRVLSALHIPTPQYRQDDPFVAGDIAAGNVAWKPKDQWGKLAPLMK